MQIPRRKVDELRAQDDGPIHLTAEGLRRLKERLAEIKRALPELIAETSRAAAYGDRSDSAEYSSAKSALRRANNQVLSIEDQLKRVVVISEGPNVTGKVELGSTVILEMGENPPHLTSPYPPLQSYGGTSKGEEKERKTFQIVGPRETNPEKGRISNQSPLGVALLGRSVGEAVRVPVRDGVREYKILEIR